MNFDNQKNIRLDMFDLDNSYPTKMPLTFIWVLCFATSVLMLHISTQLKFQYNIYMLSIKKTALLEK